MDPEKGECRDKVGLGDVVIADYVDYSEFRKLSGGRSALRRIPYDHPSHALRTKFTHPLSVASAWAARITTARPDGEARLPRAHIGNVLACEKLLGDPENAYQKSILDEFDKAVAIDMESYGFARAVFEARWSVHYNPQYAVIRGISDIANETGNNAVRELWRDYAAEAAAAFVAATIHEIMEVA
jgi:nucleoside phosphorylase